MKKYICIILFIVALSSEAYALNLTATLSSPQAALGEEFELTLTADEDINATPDLSPLQSAFKISSTSVSRRSFYNNGQQSSSTTWKIRLLPLQTGKQTIPAIKIGHNETSPLTIEIVSPDKLPASQAPASQDNPYVISGNIVSDDLPLYVQQQIIYHVILQDNGNIISGEPAFQLSNSDEWIIKLLGKPEISSNSTGDKRTIKYAYALFPQKSGKLKIPAVIFDGTVLGANNDSNAGFNLFGNDFFNININVPALFQMNTPIRLVIPAKEIDILPAPEEFKGSWWLPAQDVKISASFTDSNPKFMVGSAINREIIIQAKGATERQLPELKLTSSNELKIYPQKSLREEKMINGNLWAIQKTNVLYIPQKSGKISFPEIKTTWFNINTQKIEDAVIPAMEVYVQKSESEIVNEPAQIRTTEAPAASVRPADTAAPAADQHNNTLIWAISAFAAGLLCSWLFFRILNKRSKPNCDTRKYPDFIIQKAYQGDFRSLRDALISWATGYFPEYRINNLKDIANAAQDQEFSRQINILLENLYQTETPQIWNAKIFVDSFNRIIDKRKKMQKNKSPLPPLYD